MESLEIENFGKILSPKLLKDKKLINTEYSRLTGPGENYGSTILSIVVTLEEEETGKEEKVYVVAKIPPVDGFMWHFMNIPVTFRHELSFYQTILPCLQQFQKDQSLVNTLNFFPAFYGGRLSLDPSRKFLDDDATILLENLKESGFTISNRNIGFDLDATKLILAKMAQFHGVSLALKTLKPEVFQKQFSPYLDEFRIFIADDNPEALQLDVIANIVLEASKNDGVCALHLDKIEKALETSVKSMLRPRNSPEFAQSKFATIIHNDLWVNNIMVKEHRNKIQDIKFIDWQMYEHGSIARNILFTIFTSVASDVLTKNLDELILFYYEELCKNLEKMKCTVFLFGDFQSELKTAAGSVSFFRILMSFPAVFAGDTKFESEDLNKKHILDMMQPSKICLKRIRLTTREFIRKGWLL